MIALAPATLADHVAASFAARFGAAPSGVAFAPGRVNLIGEHVDYNDGLVLPLAISAGTAIAWRARQDGRVAARALDFEGEEDDFALSPDLPAASGWRTYLRGMSVCMADRGLPVAGADLVIAGSIPRGSGLSSSASLCVAVGRALAAAAGEEAPDPIALSLAAQAAEHRFAGVRCGIMDQVAVAAGQPGHALLLDCRDLATRQVALPPDWAVMIVQSGVVRELVDGHYNRRRLECEAAAKALGVASLRDAALPMVEAAALDPVVQRRARHVASEIARTAAMVEAVEHHDIATAGRLLGESHRSLRDDFEVSVPQVDRLVEQLDRLIGGAGGARMTGGGFGGAVVALMTADRIDTVRSDLLRTYRTPAGAAPDIMVESRQG
ncbi:MAG: galactokinase [Sphingomonadales bacterium]|nr:galactokinase [Sphingomonadales bacterium]MDE2569134.1 galactokinase [Sphingomonadales bacterium]